MQGLTLRTCEYIDAVSQISLQKEYLHFNSPSGCMFSFSHLCQHWAFLFLKLPILYVMQFFPIVPIRFILLLEKFHFSSHFMVPYICSHVNVPFFPSLFAPWDVWLPCYFRRAPEQGYYSSFLHVNCTCVFQIVIFVLICGISVVFQF